MAKIYHTASASAPPGVEHMHAYPDGTFSSPHVHPGQEETHTHCAERLGGRWHIIPDWPPEPAEQAGEEC